MENLIKKLQDEVGITEEQAIKAITLIKDFMNKEGMDIDWESFFKGKYEDLKEDAKSFFDKLSDKAKEYTTKVSDKVEDLSTDAKRKARDASQKAEDFFDDKK